jgi:PAP2 superfamily
LSWVGDLFQDVRSGDYLFVAAFALLAIYVGWRIYCRLQASGVERRFRRFFGLSLQIGLTLMLERLYEFSRAHVAVSQLTALAYSNGYKLAQFEIIHGFFFEPGLEHFFTPDVLLMNAIYGFYAFAHLFVTLGFLVWLYLRRNTAFLFVRNLFYMTTGVSLIMYMTFPTAPPRLFSNLGFFDPMVVLGITPAGGVQVNQWTYNPFAAMPSLHMVYALIVGATLVVAGRSLWLRVVGAVYPFIMLAVVLISGNHWILDAVGAVVVVAGSAAVLAFAGKLIAMTKSLTSTGSGRQERLAT